MKRTKILLVEDDDVDIMAFKRALRLAKIESPLEVVNNGREALQVLRGGQGDDPFPPPFVIVLDLNMPMMNGIEFLSELRSDAALRVAVVFVLTTSSAEDDLKAAYSYNIAGYFLKDNLGQGMHKMADVLISYDSTVVLPD